MNLLDVYNPEIDVYVRYKVLDPVDIDIFTDEHSGLEHDDYIKNVMETVVYNLHTDVLSALRSLGSKEDARSVMEAIYNGCIMLNPGLDVDSWLKISTTSLFNENAEPVPIATSESPSTRKRAKKKTSEETKAEPDNLKKKKITKAKFKGLKSHLESRVIGQGEAIDAVVSALKLSVAGLADENRPIGVFLFAGSSGVGKTLLAKELNDYLFDSNIVRIDCGEYQQKHENQKLIGSPNGYVGFDEEGGQLTKSIAKNPNTVLLLDEVEKAHPDIWDTFLRVFDEGVLTGAGGKEVSFKNTIVIMTTNLGNKESLDHILQGGTGFHNSVEVDIKNSQAPRREIIEQYVEKSVRKKFKPEFLNRIDKTVVFNHLNHDDMYHIAHLELETVANKLKKRGIRLDYGDNVVERLIEEGVNPVEGARGLTKIRRDIIEDCVSDEILSSSWPRGSIVTIKVEDGVFNAEGRKPKRKKNKKR